MSTSYFEVAPRLSQPLVFWGVIGTLVAIIVGLVLAVIRLHPQSWSWVREVQTRWVIYRQELHEEDPCQSLQLPIQSPPTPPPPRPSTPIPIPTRNPSLRSFDTFSERPPLRVHNLDLFRRQREQAHGGLEGPHYV